MRFLLLFALLLAACGSSSKSDTTPKDSSMKSEKVAKKTKKKTTKKTSKKKKKKKVAVEVEPPPFEPPALDSLPERGDLRMLAGKRPASSLKKVCPKRGRRGTSVACVCPSLGDATADEAWGDQASTCSAKAEGLEAPLLNVQLLAVQTTGKAKRGEESGPHDAVFNLMLQTRKGFFLTELGRAAMDSAPAYPATYTLASRSFADLPAGKKALLATIEQKASTPSESGDATSTRKGWLVVCSAANAKKVTCTAPMPLGEVQDKGGYQLSPVVEEGALYLVDATANTPEDLKEVVGKYTLRR